MRFTPTDEHKMVRKFAETHIKPVAAELDRTHRHPEDICRELSEMGLMGPTWRPNSTRYASDVAMQAAFEGSKSSAAKAT